MGTGVLGFEGDFGRVGEILGILRGFVGGDVVEIHVFDGVGAIDSGGCGVVDTLTDFFNVATGFRDF